MNLTCPSCLCDFPIEAGYADADGKRLAALFAEMEPSLGRAVISYLRLFKPAKTGLRMARAVKLVQQLLELVNAGTVCRDERGGVRRPASPATWTAAIELMLQGREKLALPLDNHNYLRAIAFGIADSADAAAERKKETAVRVGKHRPPSSEKADPQGEKLAWLKVQLSYQAITQEEYDREVRELQQ
jgi:hypothetical protein